MNCWTILNLEPTTDERQIRRAYAKILKTIDQDQEPERFIALRAALEQAQSWAAWQHDEADDDDEALNDAPMQPSLAQREESTPIPPNISMVWHPPQIEIEQSTWQTEPSVEPPVQAVVDVPDREPTEPTWHERVDDIRQRMWADEWNGQLLMDLRALLRDVQEQSLSVQMEAYETLSYPLAWADEDQDLTHFLNVFFQVFDVQQLEDNKAEDHEHKLFARYQLIKANQEFWQSIPTSYHPHLQALMEGEQQQICFMRQLQQSTDLAIQKWFRAGMPLPTGHRSLATNLTYQTLIRMQWPFYVPVLAFLGWGGWIAASTAVLNEDIQWLMAIGLLLSFAASVLTAYPRWVIKPAWGAWYGLIITMLGFLVFASLPVLSESAQWWLSVVWLFGFLVWFGFLGTQHQLDQWFDATKQIARNTLDWVVIAISWFALISMMFTLSNLLTFKPVYRHEYEIASLFGFLPLSALLYREAWVESFQHAIRSISAVPMLWRVMMASIPLILMGIGLWLLESGFAALMLLGAMGFLLAFPSRFKAYIVKYLLYVLLMLWAFSSGLWLGVVVLLVMAGYAARRDYVLRPAA
jgi:hypothetical protein